MNVTSRRAARRGILVAAYHPVIREPGMAPGATSPRRRAPMGTAVVRSTTEKLEADIRKYEDDSHVLMSSQFVGGRDWVLFFSEMSMLSIAEEIAPLRSGSTFVRVEDYGPDHRMFIEEGGPALPPDTAGLVEDHRRTWILYFGHDGRPTHLWLERGADGGVIGRSVLPCADLSVHVPADGAIPEKDFVDVPDPMVWAEAFASRFAVRPRVTHDEEPVGFGDVAGLMVGWFSNFATAWERQVRTRIAGETRGARVVVIRRQDNGWDRFAFIDDDGRTVGEHTVDPRHVTVVHDRGIQPGWAWPTG